MQEALTHITSNAFLAKLENALPDGVTPKRFASVAVAAIKGSPELIAADRESLYNAIVRCAQDGLMPDGKEAALVIYKDRKRGDIVRYMPMVGGFRKIAATYGISIVADVVRDGDTFDYSKVPPALAHKPAPLGKQRGDIIGAYAVAYRAGKLIAAPEVMEPAEIEKVRAVSRSAKSEYGPWVNWWDRMAAKTVARRLFAQLPLADTDEQTRSVIAASDNEFDFGDPVMTEEQANIAATITQLPAAADEEVVLRDDPAGRASDAVLNRIAYLQEQVGEAGATMTLRGVFGVDTAAELAPADAERYVRMLEDALGDPIEGEIVEDGEDSPGAVVAQEGGEAAAVGTPAAASNDEGESPYSRAARRATSS